LQLACWWNTLNKFTSGVIALTVTGLSQEEVLTDHIFIDGFSSCFSWRISQPETSTEIALLKYQSRSLREKILYRLEKDTPSLLPALKFFPLTRPIQDYSPLLPCALR